MIWWYTYIHALSSCHSSTGIKIQPHPVRAFDPITPNCVSSAQQHVYCPLSPAPHTVWVAESTALLPGCHGVWLLSIMSRAPSQPDVPPSLQPIPWSPWRLPWQPQEAGKDGGEPGEVGGVVSPHVIGTQTKDIFIEVLYLEVVDKCFLLCFFTVKLSVV